MKLLAEILYKLVIIKSITHKRSW